MNEMDRSKLRFNTHKSVRSSGAINPTLIKLKNLLKFGRRWSTNPQKQLCFSWLAPVMARSGRYETTLDVACGNLNNYPFIKSENYIGVDMNLASLEFGEKVYPEATTRHLKIEELEGSGLMGDLVICTQTIGVNSLFQSENTLDNIKSLIDCTKPGGMLVFDTGEFSLPYIDDITKHARERFSDVSVRAFGSFDRGMNMPVSVLLALLMQVFPGLRTRSNANRRFFVCTNRT